MKKRDNTQQTKNYYLYRHYISGEMPEAKISELSQDVLDILKQYDDLFFNTQMALCHMKWDRKDEDIEIYVRFTMGEERETLSKEYGMCGSDIGFDVDKIRRYLYYSDYPVWNELARHTNSVTNMTKAFKILERRHLSEEKAFEAFSLDSKRCNENAIREWMQVGPTITTLILETAKAFRKAAYNRTITFKDMADTLECWLQADNADSIPDDIMETVYQLYKRCGEEL